MERTEEENRTEGEDKDYDNHGTSVSVDGCRFKTG